MAVNTLSIDLEDYFMVENFSSFIRFEDWEKYPLRLELSVPKLLDLLEAHQVRATFFILGWVAQKLPRLVKEVAQKGHEIACHGYSHRPVFKLGEILFEKEIRKAKKILEDLCGKPVLGYRAATYSINSKTPWIWDVLAKTGFRYDSSYRPFLASHWKGLPINTTQEMPTSYRKTILEYPITVKRFCGLSLPFYGGGYFRLFPLRWIEKGISQLNQQGKSANVYLHPWEIDPQQPRLKGSGLASFRHYVGLHQTEKKLVHLMKRFSFKPIQEVLPL